MSTTQILWLMYKGDGNLQWEMKKRYINDPRAQRFLGKLYKGKALKEVKLVDGLVKYKQNQIYMPQKHNKAIGFLKKTWYSHCQP